jgi:hypothetical protein
MALADLTVLDAELPGRLEEIDRWVEAARPGAVIIIHDAANGRNPGTTPHLIRTRVEDRGIAGVFLRNPRGGFLGVQLSPGIR